MEEVRAGHYTYGHLILASIRFTTWMYYKTRMEYRPLCLDANLCGGLENIPCGPNRIFPIDRNV